MYWRIDAGGSELDGSLTEHSRFAQHHRIGTREPALRGYATLFAAASNNSWMKVWYGFPCLRAIRRSFKSKPGAIRMAMSCLAFPVAGRPTRLARPPRFGHGMPGVVPVEPIQIRESRSRFLEGNAMLLEVGERFRNVLCEHLPYIR